MLQDDIFRVDRYEIKVEVRPLIKGARRVRAGGKERELVCDNAAHIERRIVFSKDNTCRGPFTLRYGTRGNGLITPPLLVPPHNEASPIDLGRYDDHGQEVTYCFKPQPGSTYLMKFEVYNGFDAGDRSVHFHLHRSTRYQLVEVTLDLRQYLEQGHPITQGPDLHFHQDDPQDHDLCKLRPLGHLERPYRTGKGLWTWQISCVNQGVVDVVWDLDGPERCLREGDPEADVREQMVIGKLKLCRVFELYMEIVKAFGPVSQHEAVKRAAQVKTRLGVRETPSQAQFSRAVACVEAMMEAPVFMGGRGVKLFNRTPGSESMPEPKAYVALALLKPYLDKYRGRVVKVERETGA